MKDILVFTFQELIGTVPRNKQENFGNMLNCTMLISHSKRTSLSLCFFILSFKFQNILTLPVPPEYFWRHNWRNPSIHEKLFLKQSLDFMINCVRFFKLTICIGKTLVIIVFNVFFFYDFPSRLMHFELIFFHENHHFPNGYVNFIRFQYRKIVYRAKKILVVLKLLRYFLVLIVRPTNHTFLSSTHSKKSLIRQIVYD